MAAVAGLWQRRQLLPRCSGGPGGAGHSHMLPRLWSDKEFSLGMGTARGMDRCMDDRTKSCVSRTLVDTVGRRPRSRQVGDNFFGTCANRTLAVRRRSDHSGHRPASRVGSSACACRRDTSSPSGTGILGTARRPYGSCAGFEDDHRVWAGRKGMSKTAVGFRRVMADAR